MKLDSYFEKYEALVNQIDAVFNKVQEEHDECVSCKEGCDDCCHALFDLTLIEALYIKKKFDHVFQEAGRSDIVERANVADRQVHRLKKQAHKDHLDGKPENEILEDMAAHRIRCPLLNDDSKCDLYESRPITCRLYGIPTVIGGKAHTCGLSKFKEGAAYPTVKLEAIQQKLYEMSAELARDIQSRYPKLAEMLVPLSMALLTDYTEEYLGVKTESDKPEENEGQ